MKQKVQITLGERPLLTLLTGTVLVLGMLTVDATTRYVNVSSKNPISPYTDWVTAATNIQDAVDVATAGDRILVGDGVYASGSRVLYGSMRNRLAVTKPVMIQSVNGPGVTTIQGYQVPGTNNGNGAIRCVWLTNGAVLAGFTLTKGGTRAAGDTSLEQSGGGVLGASLACIVSNCVLIGNSAHDYGGGACSNTLFNCTLTDNYSGHGGGASRATLNNCMLTNNSSYLNWGGGGAWDSTLNNCVIKGNYALWGGGTYAGTLNNCTVTGNSAQGGGGALYGTLNNCIVYYNTSPDGNCSSATINYCCTTPLPASGVGNFRNEPLFVDRASGDLRLASNSPCINAGLNTYAPSMADLDGALRISGGTVDVGAYEFPNPTSRLSHAWLQSYNLPTDGSADDLDSDHDGMSNWQEWLAGTDPTSSASTLRFLPTTNTTAGMLLSWASVPNRAYFLERSTNLADSSAFSVVQSNLAGQTGTTTYTDTNVMGSGRFYYRVGVQR